MDGKGWIKKDVGREKEGHWRSHELILYDGVFWRGGDPKVYGSMNAIVEYLGRNSGISSVDAGMHDG